MMRQVIGVVIAVWFFAGCTSATSSMVSEAQECTRGGGWWRSNLGVCEIQGEGKR